MAAQITLANQRAGMTFLAVDVGNTRLKWALYDQGRPGAALVKQGAVFIEHIDELADGEWRTLTPHAMLGCNVTGDAVRRRIDYQMEAMEAAPRWVVPQSEGGGLINRYEYPTRLGADRWAAMVGAKWHVQQRMKQHPQAAAPIIVVMIGTAVTVEAIDVQGAFLGGLIIPGHGIMLKALESGTAGLRVPTGEVRDFPLNTSDALTSGGTFAITGAIEAMHRRLHAHTGASPVVLMTGGAGWKVSPHLGLEHTLIETLIFDGLLRLHEERVAFGVTGF
jgi:type III pantothenate kinase